MANQPNITLVTGGSGYLAGWVIARLLQENRPVRATLRNLDRADEVRANIESIIPNTSGLEFAAADLLADEGWDLAMTDVNQVAHVASPVMDRKGVDTIATALEGTTRVLNYAAKAGVKRLVVTSSAVAANPVDEAERARVENDWTDVNAEGVSTYAKSKTLAERAAWDFARAHASGPEIATILPAFIQGPKLGNNASASLILIEQMLNGEMPMAPRLGFAIVDVRDLAELHVRVLNDPKAMGERWVASSDFLWMSDMAQVLREEFGEAADKAPTTIMPDDVFRAATANTDMAALVQELGRRSLFSSAKATSALGWMPRSAREAVIATGRSMLATR